jgi:large repetitive protein
MRKILRFVHAATVALTALPAWSEVQPAGREIRVNRQMDSKQRNPVAAFAGSGRSVVVWENSNGGLRALFYGADGRPSGAEVTLVANQTLSGIPASGETVSRVEPAAAFLPSGELALAWIEERADLRVDHYYQDRKVLDREVAFQRFTAGGQPIGSAAILNAAAAGLQQEPRIALLGGKILVVWETAGGGLSGRLLNPQGQPLGDEIAIAEAGATRAAVAVSRNRALVTWEAPDGNDTGIFAQLLDAAGAPVGPSLRVNTTTEDRQRRAAVTAGPDGSFFVLWQSRMRTVQALEERIFGQLVGAAGNLVGPQLRIETGAGSGYVQMAPAIAPAPGGRFLVTWVAWPDNRMGLEIAGREIDVTGQAVGELFWLTEQRIQQNFRRTSLATDGAGHFLMPWETIFRQKTQVIGARRLAAD